MSCYHFIVSEQKSGVCHVRFRATNTLLAVCLIKYPGVVCGFPSLQATTWHANALSTL